MNEVICRANIYTFHSDLIKKLVRWGSIICMTLLPLFLILIIPVRDEGNPLTGHHYVNIIGLEVVEVSEDETEIEILPYCGVEARDNITKIIKALFVIMLVSFIPAIYNIFMKIYNYIAQKCYLELYADELVGVNATLFSRKTLKLPIERVDNISIEHTIINKIIGGPTVVICSSSGKIKFNWVQNAQEFMDKVFETINQYKTSVASNSSKSEINLNAQNDDSIEKIIKLKNLLDQGVITQEEFEEKKKKFFQEI